MSHKFSFYDPIYRQNLALKVPTMRQTIPRERGVNNMELCRITIHHSSSQLKKGKIFQRHLLADLGTLKMPAFCLLVGQEFPYKVPT
jgi:hypothetical protein